MAQRILLHNDSDDGAVFSVVLIQNKGRDDAHAVKTGPLSSSNRRQCVDRCRGQERRCLVDCIAQHDPVAGSVMRYVMLQDELPY